MSRLCPISPIGLTVISVAIGLIFAATMDSDELNIVGNVLIGIGGIMIIAATEKEFINGLKEKEEQKDFMEKLASVLRERKS
ncbi:MAG: hypothetical protein ACOX4M_07635 [Acetivibrionales bacterium]|jgi:Na+/phosphate symporter